MREEPFDRCSNCGKPANPGDTRAWYIARFRTKDPDDHRLHIRGVLCDECSHELGHGKEWRIERSESGGNEDG